MTKRPSLACRVTMIGSLPPQRGVSPYMVDLSTSLADRDDVDLDVIAFRSLYPRALYPGGDPDDGSTPVDVRGAATRRPLRWWNPFGWLLAGLTLRGDIVHAQWWSYPLAPMYVVLLACARARRKTVVLTIHNVEPHEGGTLRRLANRAVLPFAHRIIVHTEQNARTLRTMWRSSTAIEVIPIGVRVPGAVRVAAGALRERIGVAPNAPTVLFFGNIRPYKGVPLLLQAFRDVREVLPSARLIIAGEAWGAGVHEIRGEIARLGLDASAIVHLSYLPEADVAQYFAAADVVVFPYTHFDAQSAAACVALGYGKAIIVANTGGLPDLVRDRRAVVAAGDAEALAEALVRVLGDDALREKLEADAVLVRDELGWDRIAEATADVYRRALRGRKTGVAGASAEREARAA